MISLLDLCYEALIKTEQNPFFLSSIFGEEYKLRLFAKERKIECSILCGSLTSNILQKKCENFPYCFSIPRIEEICRRKYNTLGLYYDMMNILKESYFDICCMEYMLFCLKRGQCNRECIKCNKDTSEVHCMVWR